MLGDHKQIEIAQRILHEWMENRQGGPNVVVNEGLKKTILMYAVGLDIEACQILIEMGASTDVEDKKGRTAFMHSVTNGKIDICKFLLSMRPNHIDHASKDGVTPLMRAVSNNDYDMLNLLLTNKANPLCVDGFGQTPLMMSAMKYGNNKQSLEICRLLLKHVVSSINDFDRRGKTALVYAFEAKNLELCKLLKCFGATDRGGQSDGYGVKVSFDEVVQGLLGINVPATNPRGASSTTEAVDDDIQYQ